VAIPRGGPEARAVVRQIGEAVRRACVEAALAGYEAASISGLCREGAFEAALSSMRRLDVEALAQEVAQADLDREAPPAAAGAVAATGALAAAVLEGAAAASAHSGPNAFFARARAVASRAAALHASLGAASRGGAGAPGSVIAMDTLVEIATRCAQVATLAAEVAAQGHAAGRRDAETSLQLAARAAECALAAAEDDLRGAPESDWTRSTRRRLWRAGLLLRRALPGAGDTALD
jgi:hypothetical protein